MPNDPKDNTVSLDDMLSSLANSATNPQNPVKDSLITTCNESENLIGCEFFNINMSTIAHKTLINNSEEEE